MIDLNKFFSVRSVSARGLDKVQELLRQLGDPQKDMKCIQIAGTNAKGSTAAMLAKILRSAPYRTGLYTSPALVDAAERFRVDGVMISDEELSFCAERVREAEERMGFQFGGFDRMTAAALLAFSRKKVEVAVLETGLGGLLDPVTAVDSCLCFLTSISMDHMQVLGNTIEEIANQKCGIMKPYVPVVTHPHQPFVAQFIRDYASVMQAPLIEVDPEQIEDVNVSGLRQSMRYKGFVMELSLAGPHQRINAAAAYEGALALRAMGFDRITDAAIRQGLSSTLWPCRLEMVDGILLDGAHNPEAMSVLREALLECFPDKVPIVLLSVMSDKDVSGVVKELCRFAKYVFCVRLTDRGEDPNVLCELVTMQGVSNEPVPSLTDGIDRLRAMAKNDSGLLPVIAGSLYLAGSARDLILHAKK